MEAREPPMDSPPEQLGGWNELERVRQEAIKELINLDSNNLFSLNLLDQLFRKSLLENGFLDEKIAELIFANLTQVIAIHAKLNVSLMEAAKQPLNEQKLSAIFVSQFTGIGLMEIKETLALFLRRQDRAMAILSHRRQKDNQFRKFVEKLESDPRSQQRSAICDFLLKEMQWLTRLPLLLDRICKLTPQEHEKVDLLVVIESFRQVTSYINAIVEKENENEKNLEKIIGKVGKKRFRKALSLLLPSEDANEFEHRLLYEGTLSCFPSGNVRSHVEVHVLLMEDMIMLLRRNGDQLKMKQLTDNSGDDTLYAPILHFDGLQCHWKEQESDTFTLVTGNTVTPKSYRFRAKSRDEAKEWTQEISNAIDTYTAKRTTPKDHRIEPVPSEESNQGPPESSLLAKLDRLHERMFESMIQCQNLVAEYLGVAKASLTDEAKVAAEGNSVRQLHVSNTQDDVFASPPTSAGLDCNKKEDMDLLQEEELKKLRKARLSLPVIPTVVITADETKRGAKHSSKETSLPSIDEADANIRRASIANPTEIGQLHMMQQASSSKDLPKKKENRRRMSEVTRKTIWFSPIAESPPLPEPQPEECRSEQSVPPPEGHSDADCVSDDGELQGTERRTRRNLEGRKVRLSKGRRLIRP